jgi:hypothetical protein
MGVVPGWGVMVLAGLGVVPGGGSWYWLVWYLAGGHGTFHGCCTWCDVPGECGAWPGFMVLGVVPGVMYQVSVVPGRESWCLLGVVPGVMVPGECGTWLEVMVHPYCGT